MNNRWRARPPVVPPVAPKRFAPPPMPVPEPVPGYESTLTPDAVWECVVCGRDVDAETIPLLAGPALCSYGNGSVTKTVRDADGTARVPVPVCPFKTAKR